MTVRGVSLRALRCFAAALMASMVLAQSLGFMHRGLHNSMGHAGHSQTTEHGSHADCSEAGKTSGNGSGWIGSLFSHQEGDSTCRLVDAQSHFDAAIYAQTPVITAQSAAHSVAFSQITSTARAGAPFEARAPPHSL